MVLLHPHTLWKLSLENTSCFPLQDICFVRTEGSEQGSCSVHTRIYMRYICAHTLAFTMYCCYYLLLAILLYATFLIHVPSMPQPPPSKLVLSRFLLDSLHAPASFLPSLYESRKFPRILNNANKTALATVIEGRRALVIYFAVIKN